jgi:hypothetical protein
LGYLSAEAKSWPAQLPLAIAVVFVQNRNWVSGNAWLVVGFDQGWDVPVGGRRG